MSTAPARAASTAVCRIPDLAYEGALFGYVLDPDLIGVGEQAIRRSSVFVAQPIISHNSMRKLLTRHLFLDIRSGWRRYCCLNSCLELVERVPFQGAKFPLCQILMDIFFAAASPGLPVWRALGNRMRSIMTSSPPVAATGLGKAVNHTYQKWVYRFH